MKISAYSPELPPYAYGSKAHPAVGGFMVGGFFGGARRRGERPVFVLEGPEAGEVARRLRRSINKHPSELPGSGFTEGVAALLESWGHKDAADEWQRRRLVQKEPERYADPLGPGRGNRWT